MKICAAKDCRLAYFQQGQLIRWKYIDEGGLFDAKAKRHIEKFAEVDELDYYMRALNNKSAILFAEEKEDQEITQEIPTQQMNGSLRKPKYEKFVKDSRK
jgi:hypothetical protein